MNITGIKYINLNRNWHRRMLLKFLLRRTRYKVTRCPGVEYSDKDPSYDKYLRLGLDESVPQSKAPGTIGCWIAHSKALEDVTEREGITVVLEDDFVCTSEFFRTALKMVSDFGKDFDIVLFDTWGKGPLEEHKVAENIYQPQNCSYPFYTGTQCLFVNNASIPKILEAKLNSPVRDYDGYLMIYRKVNAFIFYTGQSSVRHIGSDIHPNYRIKYGVLGILASLAEYAVRPVTTRLKVAFCRLRGEALG